MKSGSNLSLSETDLRQKMRDLVALSALSALWTGANPSRIAASLAEVLLEMLGLEFIYIRLWNPNGKTPIEIARNAEGQDVLAEIGRVCRSFSPSLPFGSISSPIGNSSRDGVCRITSVPIGRQGEWGVIVASAQRDGFPSETERLLITVAANQSGVMIGHEQASQQAEAERSRWRDLLQQAPAAVAVLRGPDHIFELVNPEYERAIGKSATELLGNPISKAVPEVVSQGFLTLLDGVYQTGQAAFGNERLIKLKLDNTGAVIDRFFNFAYQPTRNAYGAIEGVLIHAVDVTEQVVARRRIQESEQQLKRLLSEEQDARATAELLNSVGPRLLSEIAIPNLVQAVVDVAKTLTGAEFGAFFPNTIHEDAGACTLDPLPGIARETFKDFPIPRHTAVFDSTFRGSGMIRSNDITKDPRYVNNASNADLTEAHLPVMSYLATPVVSRTGNVIGGLFFADSLPGRFTHRHEAIIMGIAAQAAIAMDNARLFENTQRVQRELQRSNEELKRANRDLEAFAYTASHDLQEPLRNVAIYSQLLQRGFRDKFDGEGAEFLEGIRVGAFRMETLIRDLLEYTRVTRTLGVPPIVESKAVLQAVLESLKASIEETRATITMENLPPIQIHEIHLSQLFQNLISNALKYRNKNEATRIHVSALNERGSYIFSISDNGIGIDPRYHTQIFGLFKRLNSTDEYKGSGVGLAICQRILEQYSGKIWVESNPTGGSVFRFAV